MRLVAAGGRILYSRIWQVLANAAVIFIVAKTLGPAGQGHYSLTVAVAQLASALLAGGMGLAAVPPLRRGLVTVARMVSVQTIWVVITSVVLFLAAVAVQSDPAAAFLFRYLGWTRSVAYLAALAATGLLAYEVFSYDLLARGRLVIGAAVNGWRAAGHLALVIVLVGAGWLGFSTAVGAFALAQALGAATLTLVLVREMRRPAGQPVPAADAEANGTTLPVGLGRLPLFRLMAFNLKRGWVGQMSAVAYFLLLRLDQALVVRWHGAAEVGVYSIAVHLGEMLWLLPGALTPLLVHSSAARAGDPERDRTASRAVRLGVLVTLAAAVPLALVAGPLLSRFAGGAYAGSAPALLALLPGIVAFAPGAVLAGDFIGRGRPNWNTQASLLTVLVNLVAGLLLIPEHGALGAAWSSSIAYACGSLLMILRFRQTTGLSLRSAFRRRR